MVLHALDGTPILKEIKMDATPFESDMSPGIRWQSQKKNKTKRVAVASNVLMYMLLSGRQRVKLMEKTSKIKSRFPLGLEKMGDELEVNNER